MQNVGSINVEYWSSKQNSVDQSHELAQAVLFEISNPLHQLCGVTTLGRAWPRGEGPVNQFREAYSAQRQSLLHVS